MPSSKSSIVLFNAPLNVSSMFIRAVLKLPGCVFTSVTVPTNTSSLWPTASHGGGGAAQLHASARMEKSDVAIKDK
jgi:hypothetical protein